MCQATKPNLQSQPPPIQNNVSVVSEPKSKQNTKVVERETKFRKRKSHQNSLFNLDGPGKDISWLKQPKRCTTVKMKFSWVYQVNLLVMYVARKEKHDSHINIKLKGNEGLRASVESED